MPSTTPVWIWVMVMVVAAVCGFLGSAMKTWMDRRSAKESVAEQSLQRADDHNQQRKTHSWELVAFAIEMATSSEPAKSNAGIAQLEALKIANALDKDHRVLVKAALHSITATAVHTLGGSP